MICPKCEYEYVAGIRICPECGSKLIRIEDLEGELARPSDWIVAFTTDKTFEAEMLQANLEGAGIASKLLSQRDRNLPGAGDLSIIKLFVKKDQASEAVEIIKNILEE